MATVTPWSALGTYLTVVAAVILLFGGTARLTRPEQRQALSRILSGRSKLGEGEDWAQAFLGWFDRVFAVRMVKVGRFELPLPSFGRSVLVSFVSLLALAMVWAFNKASVLQILDRGEVTGHVAEQSLILVAVYGGATVLSNWVPDYLSLIQSRLILGRMAKANGWITRLAWLLLDAVATGLIAFLSIYLVFKVALPFVSPYLDVEIGCFKPGSFHLDDAWDFFIAGVTFQSPPAALNYDFSGVYLYSTYLTSIWLWLYLGSAFIVRGLRLVKATNASTRSIWLVTLAAVALTTIGFGLRAASVPRHLDAYIIVDAESEDEVAALVERMEQEGLQVRVDSEYDARAAKRADVVIPVLPSSDFYFAEPGTFQPTAAERASLEAQASVDCGERPDGALLHTTIDALERQGEIEVLLLRTRDSSLEHSPDHINQCREQMGLEPLPSCEEARQALRDLYSYEP